MDLTDLTQAVYARLQPRQATAVCRYCKRSQNVTKKPAMTDIDPIVQTVFAVIAERLKQGEVVTLGSFGSFAVAKQVFKPAGRVGRSRKTKRCQ